MQLFRLKLYEAMAQKTVQRWCWATTRQEAEARSTSPHSVVLGSRPCPKIVTRLLVRHHQTQCPALFRDLALWLRAGFHLDTALMLRSDVEKSLFLKSILIDLHTALHQGFAPADAFDRHRLFFGDRALALLSAHQNDLSFVEALDTIYRHLDSQQRLKKKIWSALRYPLVLGCLVLGSLYVMMTQVLPNLSTLTPPQPETQAPTFTVVDALCLCGGVVASAALLAVLVARWRQRHSSGTEPFTTQHVRPLDGLARIPLIGSLITLYDLLGLVSVWAHLVAHHNDSLEALRRAISLLFLHKHRQRAQTALANIEQGIPFSQALASLLPAQIHPLIHMGETTHQLAQTLAHARTLLHEQLETKINTFLAWLEPAAMVVMAGGMVAVIVYGLMPFYDTLSGLSL